MDNPTLFQRFLIYTFSISLVLIGAKQLFRKHQKENHGSIYTAAQLKEMMLGDVDIKKVSSSVDYYKSQEENKVKAMEQLKQISKDSVKVAVKNLLPDIDKK